MKKAPATEAAKRQTRDQDITPLAGGHTDRVESLRTALLDAGIEPLDPFLLTGLPDGQLVRFKTASKPGKKKGWIVVHYDRGLPFVAIAGDWVSKAQMKWVAGSADSLSPAERRELKKRLAEVSKARAKEQARRWEQASSIAAKEWHDSAPANPNHPYLVRKCIQPHRARQQGKTLVLLLTDFTGKAWTLQRITGEGEKRLMAGGRKAGHFIVVDGPSYPARVLVCEGYATGCTLSEMDPDALVLAAVDAGNLQAVATGARNRWPDTDLIVCGDDDRKTPGNPGVTAARSAAIAAGARLALPEWPPAAPLHLSDFNDLVNWERGRNEPR